MDKLLERIAVDPRVMTGQAVIRGTRITVSLVLQELGRGATPQDIIDAYPHLKVEDIRAAAAYAAAVISGETLFESE